MSRAESGAPRRLEFHSTARLKEVMAESFLRLDRAAREKSAPVAWCTSVGPVELLRALGFEVYFPENHGAILGATRTANRNMARAHAAGYSQDVCSYLTSDVGSFLAGTTPLESYGIASVPRADVLVYSTNQCRDVRDWFEFFGREWKVPVLGVTAPRGVDEVTAPLVDAVAHQIEAMIAPLEGIAGHKLEVTRLHEAVWLAHECSELWKACLETGRHRPSPLTFFDGTVHMGPAVVLRGTKEACAYYRLFLEELRGRVRDGVAAVDGESLRLYWDGMPIWGRLREHSELLAELGACVVASTYCNSWIFDALDPADPIRSMARASLELFIARSERTKEEVLQRTVEHYSADGIIFHDCRTCPNNTNTRYGLPRRLQEAAGIAGVVLEGDHNDERCYSSEQSRTSLEGFVEQLADR